MIRSIRNLFREEPIIYVFEGVVQKETQLMAVKTCEFYPTWVYLKCKSIFINDRLFFVENDSSTLCLPFGEKDDKFEITLHSIDYDFQDRKFLLRFRTRSKKLYRKVKKHLNNIENQRESK